MLRSFFTTALFATALTAGGTNIAVAETKSVIVAGGCFWCVESDFDHVEGVKATTSGYAGGTTKNPTYRNHADHREVVKIDYDPSKTDYKTLVTTFLRTIDPTDGGGQFCDRGQSYAPALFATTPEEEAIAAEVIAMAAKELDKQLAVPIKTTTAFTTAEDYHLDYYLGTNKKVTRFGIISQADAYKKYREACGRDARVKQVWGQAAYDGVMPHGS